MAGEEVHVRFWRRMGKRCHVLILVSLLAGFGIPLHGAQEWQPAFDIRIEISSRSGSAEVHFPDLSWYDMGHEIRQGGNATSLSATARTQGAIVTQQPFDEKLVVVAFTGQLLGITGDFVDLTIKKQARGEVVVRVLRYIGDYEVLVAELRFESTDDQSSQIVQRTYSLPAASFLTRFEHGNPGLRLVITELAPCWYADPNDPNAMRVKARVRVENQGIAAVDGAGVVLEAWCACREIGMFWPTKEFGTLAPGESAEAVLDLQVCDGTTCDPSSEFPIRVRARTHRADKGFDLIGVTTFLEESRGMCWDPGNIEITTPTAVEDTTTTPEIVIGSPDWTVESGSTEFDGRTFIIVGKESGRCLDVDQASTANSANVVLWDIRRDVDNAIRPAANQQWRLEDVGDGYYKIVNVLSSLCLDVKRMSSENGGNVQQYACNDGANQKWKIQERSSGYYSIMNAHSGKCLDAAHHGTDNGANIFQWSWNGGANQLWALREVAAPESVSDEEAPAVSITHFDPVVTSCPDLDHWGGEVISWEDALAYVGQKVVVEGQVAGARFIGETTELSLGNRYTSPFRVAVEIPKECEEAFTSSFDAHPLEYFVGEKIWVYGLVERPDDVAPPVIELCSPDCVRILLGFAFGDSDLYATLCPDLDNWEGAVVSWEDARDYLGERVVLEGPVVGASLEGQMTVLALGDATFDRVLINIPTTCDLALVDMYGEQPAMYFVGKTIRVHGLVQNGAGVSAAIIEIGGPECVLDVSPVFVQVNSESGTQAPSMFVPIFMEYVDRYFKGIADTPQDLRFRSIVDAMSVNGQERLKEGLESFLALPQEAVYEMYGQALDVTSPSLQLDTQAAAAAIRAASSVPASPSDLVVRYLGSRAQEFDPAYVGLEWSDNSDDEDAFLVYRKYIPANGDVLGYFMPFEDSTIPAGYEFLVELPPNTESYSDYPGDLEDVNDQFCYVVLAAKDDVLGTPRALKSWPTNPACFHHPASDMYDVDSDGDGLIDQFDCCPCIKVSPEEVASACGCPDADRDGLPDSRGNLSCSPVRPESYDDYWCSSTPLDACRYDPGPYSNNGCPLPDEGYSLQWIGMQVLHNSRRMSADCGIHSPGCQNLLELFGKYPLDFNEEFNDDICCSDGDPEEAYEAGDIYKYLEWMLQGQKGDPYKAEEPYVVFSLIDGVDLETGLEEAWTLRWCCGDKVIGVENWPDDPAEGAALKAEGFGSFEPDWDWSNSDPENPWGFAGMAKTPYGLQIFPNPDLPQPEAYAVIDGLIVELSLWEKDYTVWLTAQEKEMTDLDYLIAAGEVALDIASCATGVGCLSLIARGIEAIFDWLLGSPPPPKNPEDDRDDYMDTVSFVLTSDAALRLTRDHTGENVVYPFYIDVPLSPREYQNCDRVLSTGGYRYINCGDWKVFDMQARLFFCLCREGASEGDIMAACSTDLDEIPMLPLEYLRSWQIEERP